MDLAQRWAGLGGHDAADVPTDDDLTQPQRTELWRIVDYREWCLKMLVADYFHASTLLTLGVIGGVLTISMLASMWAPRKA